MTFPIFTTRSSFLGLRTMSRRFPRCARWAVILGALGGLGMARAATLSPTTDAWARKLIPLPQEIAVGKVLALPSGQIGVRALTDSGPAQAEGIAELQKIWTDLGLAEPKGRGFEILVASLEHDESGDAVKQLLTAADLQRLKACPNADQAYLIRSVAEKGLLVAGLSDRGVYYGLQTLIQLLRGSITKDKAQVPLVAITDWPDFAERGMWNTRPDLAPLLGSLKLNNESGIRVGLSFKGSEPFSPATLVSGLGIAEDLKKYGFMPRAKLAHYNYWQQEGQLYDVYPELEGMGDSTRPDVVTRTGVDRRLAVPNASNPLFAEVVARTMTQLAEAGFAEANIWLSEFEAASGDPETKKIGQLQAEVNATVKAWKEVRENFPNFGLSIFMSLGTRDTVTLDMLMAIPPEVKIERCYTVFEPFYQAAGAGRYVTSYSAADFPCDIGLTYRVEENRRMMKLDFDRKLKGSLSISPAEPELYRELENYTLCAIAEWSWNIEGRDEREFALAWALREGYTPPEAFADWIMVIQPIETAFGNQERLGVGYNFMGDNLLAPIRKGEAFKARYDRAQVVDWLQQAEAAEKMAEKIQPQNPLWETRYVIAYLQYQLAMNDLADAFDSREQGESGKATIMAALEAAEKSVDAMLAATQGRYDHGQPLSAGALAVSKKYLVDGWLRMKKELRDAVEQGAKVVAG